MTSGRRPGRWWRGAFALIYKIAAFLAGALLLVYPWLERWERNYFAPLVPYWSDTNARGVVSGLGLATIVLVLAPALRWRRRGLAPGSLQ
ncbi:MAG: hypothetical protein AAB225_29415 [Acidobacteriota bacterium]